MAPEPISEGDLKKISPISLCLYVYSVDAWRRLGKEYHTFRRLSKHVLEAKNTPRNRRITERVIFCAVPVLSKESLWICLWVMVNTNRQRRSRGHGAFSETSFSTPSIS
jgi:hypothetical protein